jgi:CHAD domain-containing protein
MSFQLKCRSKIGLHLQEIAVEQMTRAISELQGELKLGQAVHKVRQRTKKLRAILQLMRKGIGRKAWKIEDAGIRDVARILGPLRDAQVLVETLDYVRCNIRNSRSTLILHARRFLAADARKLRERLLADGVVVQAIAALAFGRVRCCSWNLKGYGWKEARKEFRKSYKRARDIARETVRNPSLEGLHEWRIRTKQLCYQARLFREVWPHSLDDFVQELAALERTLGSDHDLAVLRQNLNKRAEILKRPRQLASLAKVINQRRLELIETALVLGDRLFGKRAADFGLYRDR